MHQLLLLAAAAAASPSPAFDAVKFSAAAAAFVLGLMRLLDTGRPLWSVGGLLPQKLQPVAIALVGVLPDLATGFQHVANVQDLANVVLAAAVGFFTSMRGQLPDNQLKQLEPEVHAKLARVQKRKAIKVKPLAVAGLALMLFAPSLLPSCASLASVLPQVVAAATQTTNILDAVQAAADDLFAVAPNAELQRKFDHAMADCRVSLSAALAAVEGADALSKEDADKAFARFRDSWDALKPLLTELGLMSADGKFKASTTGVTLPEPLLAKPLAAKK